MSNLPIKEKSHWPLTVIGGDFRNEELFPEQEDFRALIDFDNIQIRDCLIKIVPEFSPQALLKENLIPKQKVKINK